MLKHSSAPYTGTYSLNDFAPSPVMNPNSQQQRQRELQQQLEQMQKHESLNRSQHEREVILAEIQMLKEKVKTSQQLSFLKDSEREYWNKLIDSNIRSGTVACLWCIKAQLLKKMSVAFHHWKFVTAVQHAVDHGAKRRGYIEAVADAPVASDSKSEPLSNNLNTNEAARDDLSIFSGTGTVSAALKHAINVMNKYNRHVKHPAEDHGSDGDDRQQETTGQTDEPVEQSDVELDVQRKLLLALSNDIIDNKPTLPGNVELTSAEDYNAADELLKDAEFQNISSRTNLSLLRSNFSSPRPTTPTSTGGRSAQRSRRNSASSAATVQRQHFLTQQQSSQRQQQSRLQQQAWRSEDIEFLKFQNNEMGQYVKELLSPSGRQQQRSSSAFRPVSNPHEKATKGDDEYSMMYDNHNSPPQPAQQPIDRYGTIDNYADYYRNRNANVNRYIPAPEVPRGRIAPSSGSTRGDEPAIAAGKTPRRSRSAPRSPTTVNRSGGSASGAVPGFMQPTSAYRKKVNPPLTASKINRPIDVSADSAAEAAAARKDKKKSTGTFGTAHRLIEHQPSRNTTNRKQWPQHQIASSVAPATINETSNTLQYQVHDDPLRYMPSTDFQDHELLPEVSNQTAQEIAIALAGGRKSSPHELQPGVAEEKLPPPPPPLSVPQNYHTGTIIPPTNGRPVDRANDEVVPPMASHNNYKERRNAPAAAARSKTKSKNSKMERAQMQLLYGPLGEVPTPTTAWYNNLRR